MLNTDKLRSLTLDSVENKVIYKAMTLDLHFKNWIGKLIK